MNLATKASKWEFSKKKKRTARSPHLTKLRGKGWQTHMEKLRELLLLLNILFSPSDLSLMCFVVNITEHDCPHEDSGSHPTQSFSPWLMAEATFAVGRAAVGGLCVHVSASLSVSACVGLLLRSQDEIIVTLKHSHSSSHMWGLPCLNVPSAVADHFTTVKRWSSFLFLTHYWTSCWCVLSLWSVIMQMLVPRWRCVSACRWFVWDEWVWEQLITGAFLME